MTPNTYSRTVLLIGFAMIVCSMIVCGLAGFLFSTIALLCGAESAIIASINRTN